MIFVRHKEHVIFLPFKGFHEKSLVCSWLDDCYIYVLDRKILIIVIISWLNIIIFRSLDNTQTKARFNNWYKSKALKIVYWFYKRVSSWVLMTLDLPKKCSSKTWPPLLDGTYYPYWKAKIRVFLKFINEHIW